MILKAKFGNDPWPGSQVTLLQLSFGDVESMSNLQKLEKNPYSV